MAVHLFETEDAEKYGVTAAVLLYNIRHWCEKNAANDKHFHEGKFWTYNSVKAFEELFPYLTARQIRTALDKLEEDGAIETGNFNASKYDRTTWYSCQIHLTKKSNGSACGVSSHTDINTDINTDDKHNARKARFDAKAHLLSAGVPEPIARDWLAHRKALRAAPTETAINAIEVEAAKAGVPLADALAECCQRGWRGFKAEWLKDKRKGGSGGGYHDMITNAAATIYGTQGKS